MTGTVKKRCRCGEARWTKCADPWYLKDFQHRGQRYAHSVTQWASVVLAQTITTKTEAEDVADTMRAAIKAGTYVAAEDHHPPPPPEPPKAWRTLDDLVEQFILETLTNNVAKKPNSKANDTAALNRLCATTVGRGRLGAQPMNAITFADLVAFRASVASLATSTWNKYRTVLGQLFAWASWNGHIARDPLDGRVTNPREVRKLLGRGKARQRNREVSEDLLDNLKEAARELRPDHSSRIAALITAALETACRIGELLALQWRDVHLERRTLFVRAEEMGAGKTGLARWLEISQPLYDLLVKAQHDPAGQRFKRTHYVFGDPYGGRIKSVDKAWATVVLRAHNLEPQWTEKGALAAPSRAALAEIDLNFNDLRHVAGSTMLASRAFDIRQVQQRLGHTNVAQTSTYVQTTAASMVTAQQEYDALRAAQQKPAAGATHYKPTTRRQNRKATDRALKLVGRSKAS
jgi:integrase